MTQRPASLARVILTVAVGAAFLAGCGYYGHRRERLHGPYYPPNPSSNAGPSSPPAPLPAPPAPRI